MFEIMMNVNLSSNFKTPMIRGVLVVFLLITASCSFKTVYNNLDYLIPAYIDHMVDIDNDLSDLVDLRTITFLKWHRDDQLPKYLNWLKHIKAQLLSSRIDDIRYEQVLYFINNSSQFWSDIRDKSSAELARLLPLLNEEQVDELFESLSESNEEFISKNISPSKKEIEQLYEERLLDNFEEWLGYLTDEQVKSLKDSSSDFQSLSHLRLKARLEWQRETREILISENIINKTGKLESLFHRLSEKHDKQYAKISTANKERLSNVILELIMTLQKDQQQHVLGKLDYYIKMIEDLKNQVWKL